MRKIIAIARCLLLLLFRSGVAWGMLLAAAGIAGFIFFNAKADNTLLHELQIRLRYSLTFAVVFLSFGMLFIACAAMRRDIDEKLMHMLTAHPVSRWQIWAGKWLGLQCLAVLALAAIFAAAGAATAGFLKNWPDPAERASVVAELGRARRICLPVQDDLNARTANLYRQRLEAGQIDPAVPEWEARREILRNLRREAQLLPPGGNREWTFELGDIPRLSPHLILEYTVYAENRRQIVRGKWTLQAADEPQTATVHIEVYPHVRGRVQFPLGTVPASGRLRLTFSGENTPYLIFPLHKAAVLLYDNGSVWLNFGRLLLVLAFHFAAVAAVGLAAGTVFTLPVAAFVSLVLYLLAVTSGFFQTVAQDLGWLGTSAPIVVSGFFLRAGVWVSGGLRLPPVINDFSEGSAIAFDQLWHDAGAGFALYLLLAAAAGIYWLSVKELDRLH